MNITRIERRKSDWLVNAAEGWQVELTTDEGRTQIVSQLDHESPLRWQVDAEFLKNGYPLFVHTFGDRWIIPTLLRARSRRTGHRCSDRTRQRGSSVTGHVVLPRILVATVADVSLGCYIAHVDSDDYALGDLVPPEHYAAQDQEWLHVVMRAGIDPVLIRTFDGEHVYQSTATVWILADSFGKPIIKEVV